MLKETMEVKVMNVCAGEFFKCWDVLYQALCIFINVLKLWYASNVPLHTYRVIVANVVPCMHTKYAMCLYIPYLYGFYSSPHGPMLQ